VFPNYVLSFVFIGVYWNNHHHLLQAVQNIDGRSLWANLHLLFWLSLIPFVTAWMGENDFATWPVAMYGIVQMMTAIAYFLLAQSLLALHGKDSDLATALGRDSKGKISIIIYLVAIPLAFIYPWLARLAYLFVVLMWLVPDRRIEKTLVK
jgi:uncharacterized membrane protein